MKNILFDNIRCRRDCKQSLWSEEAALAAIKNGIFITSGADTNTDGPICRCFEGQENLYDDRVDRACRVFPGLSSKTASWIISEVWSTSWAVLKQENICSSICTLSCPANLINSPHNFFPGNLQIPLKLLHCPTLQCTDQLIDITIHSASKQCDSGILLLFMIKNALSVRVLKMSCTRRGKTYIPKQGARLEQWGIQKRGRDQLMIKKDLEFR